MPSFSVEYERLWADHARRLGRDLTGDESLAVEGELFNAWIAAGRHDELIRRILANHGREGGRTDIAVLGHHLRKAQDAQHIHVLFGGLISRRVKAFHGWWAKAAAGHVGGMREAAKAAAEAMDAYTEYFISLDALGLTAEKESLRAEMQRFQAREPLNRVLPKARPSA